GFGKAGSFEGFCSGSGIAKLAKDIALEKLNNGDPVGFCKSKSKIDTITAKSVFEAAHSGDETALSIVEITATYLGKGLAIIIDTLNPEKIVIGSIYARNEELFKPYVEVVLNREAIPEANAVCKIVPASLGEKIGEYAALCVALQS
ncbi:MAG: ROK family protein, partial [Bacteroidales bacterium]|nr:ROK family protein [Bacteroidales bacterium]